MFAAALGAGEERVAAIESDSWAYRIASARRDVPERRASPRRRLAFGSGMPCSFRFR